MDNTGAQLLEDSTAGTSREDRAGAWAALSQRMPQSLNDLLDSPVYGRGVGRAAAPKTHGVYMFSENAEHLYVGRTGRTERSVKAGKRSASGFRARLAGHSTPGAGLSSASFALRLAMESAADEGLEVPAKRSQRLASPRVAELFTEAKQRITAMEFRVVEIEDDRESAVFEVYAAFILATPYNFFATS